MEQSPRGFASNTIHPKAGYVVTQALPDIGKSFLNTSITDDLLNLSQSSFQPQLRSGSDIFEKFFIKFNNLSIEIEGLQRTYPQLIGGQVMDKLIQLKRDTGILSQEMKRMDSKASNKIIELEDKCDVLNNQIVKLKEEVENLVAINTELYSKLGEGTGNKSFLDITPKSTTDKINFSQFQASEDKLMDLKHELKEIKTQLESEKSQKKSYFAQVEWLRNNLEDSIKKYNEILQEKLNLQDTLSEYLKDGDNDLNMSGQIQNLREKEVFMDY